jgi:hypothetical protein
MSHIPDDLVLRGIKYVMERNSQFHNTQAGRQMSASFGHGLNNLLANFISQEVKFINRESLEVFRGVNLI